MRRQHPLIIAISYLTMAFLYLPLAGVAIFSVNAARRGMVWKGFTLKWYLKLFENDWILEAAWNTLLLAGDIHHHRHDPRYDPGHRHGSFSLAQPN